ARRSRRIIGLNHLPGETPAMSFDLDPFLERRRRFAEAIGDALAIIPAAREIPRNADTNFEFRQSSDFYFLTGFDEPDAVAVINPGHAKERFALFVRPRDREMEIWNGRRAGVEGAVATYGADAAYTIDELDAKLREYAVDRPALAYRLGNPQHDGRVTRLLGEMRSARARAGLVTPTRVEDPGPILDELRLRRSPAELARQRRACQISRDAHVEAMRYARPGQFEYEVQAAIEFVFRRGGSPRNAYPSIVASGPNATILHYSENSRRMEDGDLLLIDAGCEWGYHAADITRTFPVNGRFTPPQRRIYEVVLRAQLAAIAAARPGARYEAMHEAARRELAQGLVDLGLLPRGLEDSLAMHHYREFYMHGTGHWLGMDVHDVGDYRVRRQSRVLEPGMVVTVEPGLYFDSERASVAFHLREYSEEEMWERRARLGMAAAKKIEDEEKAAADKVEHAVPREYRGIGVRIEDDVLITEEGAEVLTAGTPKAVDEVERTCAEAPHLPQ
ncbi:MAG TPA: aminopeptidase P N-terminal domain-containing protein, partial [Candidatus Methylomirabilis sp.]|nr:aminopeptidase P N-terminal domain-containing protein [Candidatus Methylomirabilis sp.]